MTAMVGDGPGLPFPVASGEGMGAGTATATAEDVVVVGAATYFGASRGNGIGTVCDDGATPAARADAVTDGEDETAADRDADDGGRDEDDDDDCCCCRDEGLAGTAGWNEAGVVVVVAVWSAADISTTATLLPFSAGGDLRISDGAVVVGSDADDVVILSYAATICVAAVGRAGGGMARASASANAAADDDDDAGELAVASPMFIG